MSSPAPGAPGTPDPPAEHADVGRRLSARAASRPTVKAVVPPLPPPSRPLDGLLPLGEATAVLDHLVAFLERTSDMVGVTDERGNIVYLNRSARSRLGVPTDTTAPITAADLFPQEAFDIYFDQIRPRILGGDVWTGYLPIRGAVEPLEMWATVVGETRPGGEVAWMVLAARDVNDWRHAPDASQRHLAYDDLTGLATRSLLMDHVAKAQTRAGRTGQLVAVAFIDLDDMTFVNHTFGNRVGDAVIVEVANRLRDSVRVIDTVARVGGDQFVVLFDGVADEDEARSLTISIQAVLESAPVDVDDRRVNVSASIGIAIARDGELGDHLIGRADTAMYEVKAERRQQSGRPAPALGPELRSVTLKDLAVAVIRRDIVPYYQRVVDIHDGSTRGQQVLARWRRPDGSTVDAGQFLGLVEDSGVSFSLDLAMLRHAANDLAGADDLGRLYVPVGPRFLRRPGVERFVQEVLAHARLDPDRLALLVPDHLVDGRGLPIADVASSLSELGVHLVLDRRPPSDAPPRRAAASDAGTIRTLDLRDAFDEVRLAPAWVRLLDDDPAAVGAAIARARAAGQRVLVGGVESDAQRRRLAELGCDLVSGHLVTPPVPEPG